MKLIPVFSVIVLAAVFAAVYGYNTTQPQPVKLAPPYAFSPGDLRSELLALAFVFAFSLLFFGYGAPFALGIEGVKFASLFSTQAVPASYLLFAVPEVVVSVSAVYLGQGLFLDYQGQGLFQQYAQHSIVLLMAALVLWLAVFFGRAFIPV